MGQTQQSFQTEAQTQSVASDGSYRRGENASRQRVNVNNNNNNNEINNARDNILDAARVIQQNARVIQENQRNNNNNNIAANNNVQNNNNNQQEQQPQPGFFEMVNVRLIIKIAFFYMVFSQDQSKRHKTFLMVALVIYYFYSVGFVHYVLRTITCGRHGNRNNNNNRGENNNNNGGNGGAAAAAENINIPTPPAGNIPHPVQSVGFFTDLRCFVISFVFSLYPTWYPVAIPLPAPPQPPVTTDTAAVIDNDDDDDNNNGEQNENNEVENIVQQPE